MRSWAELDRARADESEPLDREEWADLAVAEVLCLGGLEIPAELYAAPVPPSAVAIAAAALAVCADGPWTPEIIAERMGLGASETIAHALRRAHAAELLVVPPLVGVSPSARATSIVRMGPRLRPHVGGPTVRKGGEHG